MGIRAKLYVSFGVITLIMVTMLYFAMTNMNNMRDSYNEVIDRDVPELEIIGDINFRIASQGAYIRAHLLGTESAKNNLTNAQNLLQQNIEKLKASSNSAQKDEKLEQLTQLKIQFDALANEAMTAFDSGNAEKANALIVEDIRITNEALVSTTTEIADLVKADFAAKQSETSDHARSTLIKLMVITIFSAIFSILIATVVSAFISRPIKKLSNSLKEIADGNLSQEDLKVANRDEIAELVKYFNKMKASLRNIIQNVSDNTNQLSAASEELAASTEQMNASSKEVLSEVSEQRETAKNASNSAQDSATAMNETAAGVQRIAESTQQLQLLATDTTDLARVGE